MAATGSILLAPPAAAGSLSTAVGELSTSTALQRFAEDAAAPAPLTPRAERRLVRAAQNGSEEALEQIFRHHWPLVHRAAYLVVRDSAAAEDIAQEAFLAAIRALDGFDRRRSLGPWLHRIAVNRAIDHSRARSLRATADKRAGRERERHESHQGGDPDPAQPVLSGEVTAALGELDPERRGMVVMRYLLEMTPGEIAATLSIPRGTVNSRLRRALDQLAAHLDARAER